MPLAALLAPQIAKKAAEIDSALGPPQIGYLTPPPAAAPQSIAAPADVPTGYLNIGNPTTLDPRGLLQDAPQKYYSSQTDAGKILHNAGELQRAGQPALAEALLHGLGIATGRKEGKMMPIPNAPAPAVVAAPAPMPVAKHIIIPLGTPGAPIGTNERGEAVDIHGRNLGYLAQPDNPIVMPQLPPLPSDWSQQSLEKTYGKNLQDMQDNRNEDGTPTDAFPQGYFDGMSKEKRKGIEAGIKELMYRAGGTKT